MKPVYLPMRKRQMTQGHKVDFHWLKRITPTK